MGVLGNLSDAQLTRNKTYAPSTAASLGPLNFDGQSQFEGSQLLAHAKYSVISLRLRKANGGDIWHILLVANVALHSAVVKTSHGDNCHDKALDHV